MCQATNGSKWYHFGQRHRCFSPTWLLRKNGSVLKKWNLFYQKVLISEVHDLIVMCQATNGSKWYHFGQRHRCFSPTWLLRKNGSVLKKWNLFYQKVPPRSHFGSTFFSVPKVPCLKLNRLQRERIARDPTALAHDNMIIGQILPFLDDPSLSYRPTPLIVTWVILTKTIFDHCLPTLTTYLTRYDKDSV